MPTKAPARPAEQPRPQNAVVVFDPIAASSALTKAVNDRRPQLAALLGVELDSDRGRAVLDRFVTVALHAATSRPDILRATRESLVESIRDAAMLGLEPVGATGDGSIVVYDEKRKEVRTSPDGTRSFEVEVRVPTAHFQPMYRGLLKLARRSDQIASIDAAVVYAGDAIELERGSEPFVRHVPVLDGSKRGERIGAYAVAELSNGRKYVDYMTVGEIEVTRKQSRAKDAMAWTSFFDEMARKTVLRRLMKRLPLETLAEQALRIENEAEERASAPLPDQGAPAGGARDRIRSRLLGAPVDAGGVAATSGDPERTLTPEEAANDVSVDPSGATAPDEVEGTSTEVEPETDQACRALSDEQLGPVETCRLSKGHPGPHVSKEDSRWPNR